MKLKKLLLSVLMLLSISGLQAQSLSPSTQIHWDKGTLVIETPERPTDQQHVLGLTAPKMETVRVAFVGLGMRGPWAVWRLQHPRCRSRGTMRLRRRPCRGIPEIPT